MPRSKSGAKVVIRKETKPSASSKIESSSRYAKVSGAIMREIIPEMYRTSVERFYRGCEDVPPDFIQTVPDDSVLVTKEDLIKCFDPKLYRDQKRHVMITGTAGTGKTTIVNRLANEIYDTKIDFTEQDYIVYVIDLRQFDGNEIMSIPHFLFNQNAAKLTAELAEYLWCITVTKAEGILFVFHNLDTAPYDFESDCQDIDPFVKSAPASIIVHNLLAGTLFPKCKILSSCREYRAKNLKGDLRPDVIVKVGELTDHSTKTLMRGFLGREHSEPVLNYWFHQAPSLGLLNKTVLYLTYSIMSVGMGEFFKLARTMPWAILNLLLSCMYQQHFPKRKSDSKEVILPIIYKMKRLAYHGFKQNKYLFEGKEVHEDFDISEEDIESTSICYPGRHETCSKLMSIRPSGLIIFIEDHIMEFMCALFVTELPIPDFKIFIEECIHTPRYCVVRRIICSLLLDENVSGTARKEKLMIAQFGDLYMHQELLLASMSKEYHKVKRRDLLEFFHAVRDCGEGGSDIIPKEMDVVDLSHIQLFTLDIQAVGACLANDVNVGYLNLSNCGITPTGLRVLADKVAFTKTKITRLSLDWNVGWHSHYTGRDGLCDILKYCEVEDLGISHTQLDHQTLNTLNMFLRKTRLKTLRVEHNQTLGDQGYAILGDFIIRHDVENLYITAENLTPKRRHNLNMGLTEYIFDKRGRVLVPDSDIGRNIELD